MTLFRKMFSWHALGLALGFAALSFPVIARLWFDFRGGGNDWRQGDWLINSGSGFVRRSLFGDAILFLGDLSGLSLLAFLIGLQALLFAVLVGLLWIICLAIKPGRLAWLLLASPAFCMLFWAGDVQSILRKELFGLLAISLVVAQSVYARPGPAPSAVAALIFCIGLIGNIAHLFMLPIFGFALFRVYSAGLISWPWLRALGGVLGLVALITLGIALHFKEVPALTGMCDALRLRGVDDHVCLGALYWTVSGAVDHGMELTKRMSGAHLGQYGVVLAFITALAVWALGYMKERRVIVGLVVLCFAPLLPLYGLATDWGRWLSLSYTMLVLLIFQAFSQGLLTLRQMPSAKLVVALCFCAILASHQVSIGWKPGGAALSLIQHIAVFL